MHHVVLQFVLATQASIALPGLALAPGVRTADNQWVLPNACRLWAHPSAVQLLQRMMGSLRGELSKVSSQTHSHRTRPPPGSPQSAAAAQTSIERAPISTEAAWPASATRVWAAGATSVAVAAAVGAGGIGCAWTVRPGGAHAGQPRAQACCMWSPSTAPCVSHPPYHTTSCSSTALSTQWLKVAATTICLSCSI